MISTDEGLPIISVGRIMNDPKLAPISAAFVQLLSSFLSQILEEKGGFIEVKFNKFKVSIFSVGTTIFSVVLNIEGNSDFVRNLIERLLKE